MAAQLYDAIFVSPHLDDAVLSAGNQIYSLTKKQMSVLVITVFSQGSNSNQPSATSFLKRSGFTSAAALFTQRKKEDRCALDILGAKHQYLDYVDAGFRNDHQTEAKIFKTAFTPHDKTLVTQISRKLTSIFQKKTNSNCQIFAPLAVGNHIDHEIVFQAIARVWDARETWQLNFWEDVPYRHRTGETATRVAQIGTIMQGLRLKTNFQRAANSKSAAVRCYTSQFHQLVANGGYCEAYDKQIECYWHA